MVDQVLVVQCLSKEMIQAGAGVIAALTKAELPVYSAAWVLDLEVPEWRLVVATPLDGSGKRIFSYKEIHRVLSSPAEFAQFGSAIGMWPLRVVDKSNPLAHLFRKVVEELPGNPGVRFSGRHYRSPYLEDSYIYRLP